MKRILRIVKMMALVIITSSSNAMAQTELMKKIDQLREKATSYSKDKEYEKSNECYEMLISEVQGTRFAELIPSFKNLIAINEVHIGVGLTRAEKFDEAKPHLAKGLSYAKVGSKGYLAACYWMGHWYRAQIINMTVQQMELEKAIVFCKEAEKYFEMGNMPEKNLEQQIDRADIMTYLGRNDEAENLLLQVIKECADNNSRGVLEGMALAILGRIELDSERFQPAIEHLERAYTLCEDGKQKASAFRAANSLKSLYTTKIPNIEKASLWEKRAKDIRSKMYAK